MTETPRVDALDVMEAIELPLLVYYLAVTTVFCVYGSHRYWLVWRFYRGGGLHATTRPPAGFEPLPRVTVQLPMFNEPHVAGRIIEAACRLDYPRELLQIQVLDDSTGDSAAVARLVCDRLRGEGFDIEHIHREDRIGFKAGALAHGLNSATGELIAVFDADFVPPPDLLRRVVDHFTDPEVGMVQTRWEHLNAKQSWLTRVQALCLDAHFIIEQTVRSRTGRWFNFNGTAGVWRRQCIDDAGGWHFNTLTEDTDLSYRAQLAGWKFRYLPDVTCPAEIPPTVSALLTQQHRWNKGLMQTGIKLLPQILRCNASWQTKLEAWFHLTSALPYAAMLLLTLLVSPVLLIALPDSQASAAVAMAVGAGCLLLGTFAAAIFCIAGQHAQGRSIWPAAWWTPLLMAVGVGISIVNTRAIYEAVMGRFSPFVRTPKFAGERRSDADPIVRLRRRLLPRGAVELMMGCLMTASMVLALLEPHTLVGVPFIALFAAGYLLIALPQLGSSKARSM